VYLPVPQFQSNALDTTIGVRAPAEPKTAPPPVEQPIEGRRLGTTYAQPKRRPNLTNTSGVLFTQLARESKAEPMDQEQEFKPATTFEPPAFEPPPVPPAPAEFPAPPPSSAPQVFDIGSSSPPPEAEPSFAERADAIVPVAPLALEQAVEQQPVPALMPANEPEQQVVAFDHNRQAQGEQQLVAGPPPVELGVEFGRVPRGVLLASGPRQLNFQQGMGSRLPTGAQVAGIARQIRMERGREVDLEADQRSAARQRIPLFLQN